MRRGLAGELRAALAGRADQVERERGRDVRDMDRRSGADRQRQVAPDAFGFGRRRHAGHAEPLGDLARVDRAVGRERAVLLVQ